MIRRQLLIQAGQFTTAALGMQALSSLAKEASKLVVAGAGAKGKVAIHPWVSKGSVIKADLLVDGKLLGKLDWYAPVDTPQRTPALRFEWPRNGTTLQLRGTWAKPKGKPQSFSRTWKVVDIGPFTSHLFDESLPLDERFGSLITQFPKLQQRFPELEGTSGVVTVKSNLSDGVPQLDAFEKKMKLRLPRELRVVMRQRFKFGDNFFLRPEDMRSPADELKQWGYSLSGISPEVRARYERSAAVFVEEADGIGLMAWDPLGVVDGESSNLRFDEGSAGARAGNPEDGVWFWVPRTSKRKPLLLLDSSMHPTNATQALLTLAQRFVLDNVDFEMDENFNLEPRSRLILDSSNPHCRLQLYAAGRKEQAELRPRDDELSFILP